MPATDAGPVADVEVMGASSWDKVTDEHLKTFLRDFLPRGSAGASRTAVADVSASDRLYQELLEFASDGIYGLNSDGYATLVNPAARRMTGWTIEDLQTCTQHSMVHHSHADGSHYSLEECPIHATLTRGVVSMSEDEVFWRKDGTSFPVAYTASPIIREGKLSGAVIIFRERSVREV